MTMLNRCRMLPLLAVLSLHPPATRAAGAIPARTGGIAGTNQCIPYQIVERGPDYRIWQGTSYDRSAKGGLVPHIHRYTELATGMYFKTNGQWLESKEQIDLLPDGTAAATQGQHHVLFPAELYTGKIDLTAPDGRHLKSRPLGIAYQSGSNTVLIAELQASTGVLEASNQIIYPDAFKGFKADLRYTYTRAGLEQDVILREQPPTPESLGLSGKSARLQVLTEFFDTPDPVAGAGIFDPEDGLRDNLLRFGEMTMIPGRAFSLANGATSNPDENPVFKSWQHLDGRSILVEELPLSGIQKQITSLPKAAKPLAVNRSQQVLGRISATRLLPAPHRTPESTGSPQIVRAELPQKEGLVLDYVVIGSGSTATSYVFQGDNTYYINGGYYTFNGGLTIEGGAVIKFDAGGHFAMSGNITCLTSPYRPAIFTAKDDNSAGEIISGSTGSPSGYYGGSSAFGDYYNNFVLHDLRFSWLNWAIVSFANATEFDNLQFVNCGGGFDTDWNNVTMNNCLFYNVGMVGQIIGGNNLSINAVNVTARNCGTYLTANGTPYVSLVNCLLAGVTNFTSGTLGGLTTNDTVLLSSDSGVFQAAGAGASYLPAASPYHGAGTTSINSTALAAIMGGTTYAPVIYSNLTLTAGTNLLEQSPRDTGAGTADLGYHYPPIDYITDGLVVTNATLTLGNGVAVACYNEPGIILQDGSGFTSMGTPAAPNWLVRYQTVQELSLMLGGTNLTAAQNVVAAPYGTNRPSATFDFTHFSAPDNGGGHFNDNGGNLYSNLLVEDCELWGGTNDFSGGGAPANIALDNNLFYRSSIFASNSSPLVNLSLYNNLICNSSITLAQPASNHWYFLDNDADTCNLSTNSVIDNSYNAYINCSWNLPGTGNIVQTNAIGYEAGPLGDYYQPAASPLVNAGSTTADQLGLYHFTTQTNEVKETNSMVDIGYHYVALNASGYPMDSNGDGTPDYLEDANGDGLADHGETPWMPAPIFTLQPTNEVLYTGGTNYFITGVTGLGMGCQWYFNGSPISGATNLTYVVANAQTNNLGGYVLVATNAAGTTDSAEAALALPVAPSITVQPGTVSVPQGTNGFLSVTAVTGPGVTLYYQWYSNSVPIVSGTNSSLLVVAFRTNTLGAYSVAVSNFIGSVTSSNGYVTVVPIPNRTVIYALSDSFWDVSNAVASASPGNLVLMPPGTCAWSNTLTLNGVSLRGCGTNETVIVDQMVRAGSSANMINLQGVTNLLTELADLQIQGGSTVADDYGLVVANGSSMMAWRIHDVFFNNIDAESITAIGNAVGLIDHNSFVIYSGFMTSIEVKSYYGDAYGDLSWTTPSTFGPASTNNVYIENNYFLGWPNTFNACQVIDGDCGARTVFRYNNLIDCYLGNHGTESGGRVRSMRNFEFYENNLTHTAYVPGGDDRWNLLNCMALIRGGSGVIFSNTAYGYHFGAQLSNYRSTDNLIYTNYDGHYCNGNDFSATYPFGGASGLNSWDSNSPACYLQGTCTGPSTNLSLTVPGAGWTVNQWLGYTLYNTNSGNFSVINGNSTDTINYDQAWQPACDNLSFNAGDGYAIYQVIAALDEVGHGAGDLLTNLPGTWSGFSVTLTVNATTGTASWPHQALDPMYMWGNTTIGADMNEADVTAIEAIQPGREYYTNTPMPGYAPLVYPHPLASSQISITSQPAGETVSLGGNAVFSVGVTGYAPCYQWYFGGTAIAGATNASLSVNDAGYPAAGNYYAVVTNLCYTAATSTTAVLTVIGPPVITVQPTNQSVAAGSSAAFSAAAAGSYLNYQWYFNSTGIAGATNSTFTISSATSGNDGAYYVIVTNTAGAATSSNAVLTVASPPIITAQPVNETVLQSSNASFSVSATGPALSYQWYLNGAAFTGATNASLAVTGATSANAGNYYVNISNAYGSTNSATVVLTVVTPPVFTLQPTNETAATGANVVLAANASGVSVGYQWYENSTAISGATNPTCTINDAQPASDGTYYAVATNAAGSATSSSAVLAVLDSPAITSQPAGETVLQTQNATFSAGATGTSLNYQWYSNSVAVAGATNTSLTINAFMTNCAGAYYVTVTNLIGAVTSSNAMLTVEALTNQPVVYAASGAYADVSNAVASASPGELVLMPPGTNTWTQTLNLAGVSLRGCGSNLTVVVDEVPRSSNSGRLITMSSATNGLTELSHLQLQGGVTNTSQSAAVVTAGGASNTTWRVDHVLFNQAYGKDLITYGTAECVVDDNLFLQTSTAIETTGWGDQYQSFSLPPTYGLASSNVLYVENNYFTNLLSYDQCAWDGFAGARVVFRNNTVWNGSLFAFGTDSSGLTRGARSFEVYSNAFNDAPGIANSASDLMAVIQIDGGSGVVYGNVAAGYAGYAAFRNYRSVQAYSGTYYPYGGATGVNPWDSNNATLFLQGTNSGPNGSASLQVAGASWTINQWFGYTLNNTNTGLFSLVTSNNASTMYYLNGSAVPGASLTFNTGDGFALYQVYAALDQPGRGSGDLMRETGYDTNGNWQVIDTVTGTQSWPNESLEGVYFWSNNLNGSNSEESSLYPSIQAGRDFYNDTAKPGYTPFQYPHPLTVGSQ